MFITVVALTSCAGEPIWPTGELHPYITKDGEHRFRYVGYNKLDPMYKGITSLDEIHNNQISGELGQQKYCSNGYEIVSKEIMKYDYVTYEGKCK